MVDRAQIDQKLHSPSGGVDLEHMLLKLRETLEALELKSRAKPRLEQPHSMGLERDPDLVAQK